MGAHSSLLPVRDASGPRLERTPVGLRVRAAGAARAVLRARDATAQAGFTAEAIPSARMRRRPILISDGPEHDAQRRELGRFLAPDVVERRWRGLVEERAEAFAAAAAGGADGRVRGVGSASEIDAGELALAFTVDVTRRIVGLTESSLAGLSRRLTAFQHQPPVDLMAPGWGRSRRQWALAAWHGLVPLARLHLRDVLPAIRARRRQPREDIVSHLLAGGARPAEILVECLTYGTAGMITTREFVVLSLWHLLEDPALAQRYRAGDRPERLAILQEIIRLDPVVGHLYRRVREDLAVADRDAGEHLAPGDLVDVHVAAANRDPDAVGADPAALCPGRTTARGVPATGLSFGAGAHRCPGEHLALEETDALVLRLLRRDPRLVRAPDVTWDDVVAGHHLEGMRLRFPGPREGGAAPAGPGAPATPSTRTSTTTSTSTSTSTRSTP